MIVIMFVQYVNRQISFSEKEARRRIRPTSRRLSEKPTRMQKIQKIPAPHESRRCYSPSIGTGYEQMKEENQMFKEFKEFAMNGNVVDMAVGIIIGGAFGTIVKSLVADVLMPPTSLAHELGRSVDRIDLLRNVLRETDRRYVRLLAGWSPRDEWASHLATLGRTVTLTQGDTEFSGVAEDVDENGMLLLRDDRGVLHRLPVGDVTSHPSGPTPTA